MQINFIAFWAAILLAVVVRPAPPRLSPQNDGQLPSPPAHAGCTFADGKTVKVDYSSPRMRGRKIFGGLVPYGEVWRTGANEAATFAPATAVTIGGQAVPAGSYTLFTIPNPGKWTLILSKATDNPYPGPAQDVVRADMEVSKPSGS